MQKTENVIDPARAKRRCCVVSVPAAAAGRPRGKLSSMPSIRRTIIRTYGQHRRIRHRRLVSTTPSRRSFDRRCVIGRRTPGHPMGRVGSGCGCGPRRWACHAAAAAGIETLLSCAFPRPFDSTRATPLRAAVDDGVPDSRTDNANPVGRHFGDASESESRSDTQAGNAAAASSGCGLQNRVQCGLILPNKRLGAIVLVPIRAKREKLPRRRWQKSQALGYDADRFMHTLVLPHRRECIERQGEVFLSLRAKISDTVRTNDPLPITHLAILLADFAGSLCLPFSSTTWKERTLLLSK